MICFKTWYINMQVKNLFFRTITYILSHLVKLFSIIFIIDIIEYLLIFNLTVVIKKKKIRR